MAAAASAAAETARRLNKRQALAAAERARLARLRERHPLPHFLLTGAHRPLWAVAFDGLSRVGKIAAQASLTRDGLVESHPSEPALSKLDVVLSFNIEVIVMEARGLRHLAPNRDVYCTMEIEGSERLQTEHVPARKPLWDTQGDFTTGHPLPVLKVKLYAVNQSMLSLEDKELGKLVLRPTVLSPKTPEWWPMQVSMSAAASSSAAAAQAAAAQAAAQAAGAQAGPNGPQGAKDDDELASTLADLDHDHEGLRIRVVVRMDRPQQLKHCGYLYGIGKSTWRKLKRRYHILTQVSQYTFVMCAYKDKKSKPTEMLLLDGYTVDYIEPPTDLIMEHCSQAAAADHHLLSDHRGHAHHHHHHHQHHHQAGLGLAGRLASALLKQQPASSSSSPDGGERAHDGNHDGEGAEQSPTAIQAAAALSDELHSKHYFNVVREGDSVVFACDDQQECFGWVMALYRATGQAHKPTPLRQYSGSPLSSTLNGGGPGKQLGASSAKGGACKLPSADVADQRARKHGMDEFITADPCKLAHSQLFKYLQHETLRHRLNEPYCSLGWFSAGQTLVLDEYCARYGVRTCHRHLCYLNSLLDFNAPPQGSQAQLQLQAYNQQHQNQHYQHQHQLHQNNQPEQPGYFVDHTLLNYGYDFCSSYVSGQSNQAHPIGMVNFDLRPDGVGTVTVEERDLFFQIKQKLLKMLERQLSNFSYCFPFGKPDGALKAALSLLERVLLKEQVQSAHSSMAQNDDVRNLIRKCLEQAALNDYTKLSGQANLVSVEPELEEAEDQQQQQQQQQQQSQQQSHQSQQRPNQGSQHHQRHLTMAMVINNERVKPRDKLKHLCRLAELCCEQVDDNNEYFAEAFAWHSDLMLEHFELFWSLFSVDCDKVLAELASAAAAEPSSGLSGAGSPPSSLSSGEQPSSLVSSIGGSLSSGGRSLVAVATGISPASSLGSPPAASGQQQAAELAPNRDAFLLFQLLNDHLRNPANLECKRFKAYLCDTFKPRLLRYVDLMEANLARSLFKACEKDATVNFGAIEQMFAKLDDLQRFVIYKLSWPEQQLAEQLQQRLKLMAYELCDAVVQRTLHAFQLTERKSNKWTAATATSYATPVDMIHMINLALETRARSLHLCTFHNFDQMSYHSKIDKLVDSAIAEMQPGLMSKLLSALESTLTKLARYDEGNLLAPILSLTTKQGMSSSGRDIGKQYAAFVSNCCDSMRQKVNDELWILNLLEEWYAAQMNIICNWLAERIDRSLHEVQLVALSNIVPKVYADMALQALPEDKLALKSHQSIVCRLKMEESAAIASGAMSAAPGSADQSAGQSATSGSIFGAAGLLGSRSASAQPGQSSAAPPASSQATPTVHQLARRLTQRTLTSESGSPVPGGGPDGAPESDNIADRALQSATRMFKGLWTG